VAILPGVAGPSLNVVYDVIVGQLGSRGRIIALQFSIGEKGRG
jgi:hypothetical protein